jgi:hypothetical protein
MQFSFLVTEDEKCKANLAVLHINKTTPLITPSGQSGIRLSRETRKLVVIVSDASQFARALSAGYDVNALLALCRSDCICQLFPVHTCHPDQLNV